MFIYRGNIAEKTRNKKTRNNKKAYVWKYMLSLPLLTNCHSNTLTSQPSENRLFRGKVQPASKFEKYFSIIYYYTSYYYFFDPLFSLVSPFHKNPPSVNSFLFKQIKTAGGAFGLKTGSVYDSSFIEENTRSMELRN